MEISIPKMEHTSGYEYLSRSLSLPLSPSCPALQCYEQTPEDH